MFSEIVNAFINIKDLESSSLLKQGTTIIPNSGPIQSTLTYSILLSPKIHFSITPLVYILVLMVAHSFMCTLH